MESTQRPRLLLPPLLLLLVFWSVSFAGLDFGVHWDETRAKFDSVRRSAETGILIQSVNEPDGFSYNYGGVNYWLTWLGFAPEVATYLMDGVWTRQALARAIVPVVYSADARFRVRAIYVVLSSLSILWLYYLCIVSGRSWHEAFLAAAILSLSWEVAYHSRWVAPDAVVMQFAVLSFLCLAIGQKRSSNRWFYLAAVAAGLTAGTKYTGALIFPFLLLAVVPFLWRSGHSSTCGRGRTLRDETRTKVLISPLDQFESLSSAISILKQIAVITTIAGATFVITNPGMLIDPFRFFGQLNEQQLIYADGWYGYSVIPGIAHFWAMIQYFSLEVFSRFAWISATLALFSLIGIVVLVLERRTAPLLIGGFYLIYLLFFAQQSAMLVRNYLVVVPFLALAAARGIVAVAERSNKRIVYAGVLALLLVNLGWDVHAAAQIRRRADFEYFLRQFEDFARRSEGETFLASARLLEELRRLPDPVPENVTADAKAAYTKVAFLQSEGADELWATWPANQRRLYDRTFGALEVNLDRYPTFIGNPRILVVRREQLGGFPLTGEYLAAPDFGLSKAAVVAGEDSYEIRIKRLRGVKVVLRYSYEGGAAEEFTVTLKSRGEARFDVGPDARKGAYRFLAYRRAADSNWYNVDATVTVK